MGIALPQLAPASEDRVSGAQVIDGALKFNGRSGSHTYGHLRRTSSGASGGGTFTISWWAKRGSMRGDWQYMIGGDNGSLWGVGFVGTSGQYDSLTLFNGSHQYSSARFRDNSAWYHIVLVVNANYGPKLWVNGEAQSNTNTTSSWNLNNTMYIGKWVDSGTPHSFDGYLAQYTCIDGLELGPSYFAYTDPLTGVWRPKKFVAEGTTVNDGTDWGTSSESGSGTVNNKSNIFDADPTTAGGSTGANTDITLTLPKSIRVKKSVRIYANQNGTAKINNEDAVTTTSGGAKWITIFDGTTDFSSITLTSTGGDTCDIRAIEVDGVMLESNATQNLAFGNSGFYLPLDGNTPIGEDLSGNNNDWTPKGFGGSTDITKATGARPILNTVNGGTSAAPGVLGSDVSATFTTTSASNVGGKYVFENEGTQPTFSFIRGATYTFDWSASSGHPLRFSTTTQEGGGTATLYSNGVDVTGNVTTITVPHDAPDTLYYYCNVHAGMGNSISVTTDETKADPYAWKCTVAMPLINYANGTKADFSHDLNCTTAIKSTDYDAITEFANPGGMFYDKVARFVGDGSNDRVRIPSGSFAMGTGDFTIEFWGHFTATGDQGNRNARILTPQSESGSYFQFLSSTSSAKVQFKFNGGGDSDIAIPNNECIDRTRHYVYQRTGTTGQLIVDGVLYDTGTDNVDYPDVSYQIGRYDSSNGGASLYMSDLRVYTGIQKYSTAGKSIGDQLFIPASTSPDILPDTPSGFAIKSKLKKNTDGAVSISRSSDGYLQVPASTNFRLDGQYCIEFFLKLTEYSNDSVYVRTFVLDGPTGDGGSTNIHLNVNPSSGAMLLWSGSSELISANLHVTGDWHHICLTRDSSNKTRLFVDGVLSGSATVTTDYDINSGSPRPRLGALGNTGGTSGYYSNWRIIKGSIPTEYQTSTTTNGKRAFSPPTEALTTTSQGATASDVKLLTCQTPTTYQIAAVAPLVSGVNSGTVWSNSITSDSLFRSGFPAADAFNETTKSNTNQCTATPQQQSQGFTFTFGEGVPFTTLQMQCDPNGSSGARVKANGVDITSQLTSGSLTNTTITGVTSPLTSLSLVSRNGDAGYLGSVTIDGTMLVDPLAPEGNAVTTNFNPFNTDINAVRGQEGAYATLDPLDHRLFTNGPSYVLSDGNLTCDVTGGNANASKSRGLFSSNMDIPLGKKIYCEFYHQYMYNDDYALGITSQLVRGYYETGGNVKPGAYMLRSNGIFYSPIEQLGSSTARSFVTGDLIGMAVDLESAYRTITWYKNGIEIYKYQIDIDQGPFKFSAGTDPGSNVATYKIHVNFGQKPFKYTPPEGFQALTSSIIKPDIALPHPDKFVKATTYVGSNAVRDINVGFKPDLIWIKDRDDSNNHNNNLIDSVNGAPNLWMSDNPTALVTNSTDGLTAITSNGFTLGANTAGTQSYELNKDGNGYIAWTWKAGGNEGTFNIDDADMGSAANAKMSIGSLNDVAFNKASLWRNNWTASGDGFGSNPVSQIFDATLSNFCNNNTGGQIVTWDMTSYSLSGRFRVRCSGTAYYIYVNGRYRARPPATGDWIDFGNIDDINELQFAGSTYNTNTNLGSAGINIYEIEVDGKTLIDSDVSINSPTIAATACSVGTKQGFSIIKYTGGGTGSANSDSNKGVPHGLGEAPDFVIGKNLNSTNAPMVYHSGLPLGTMNLSALTGNDASSFIWAKRRPSKHEVFLGNNPEINGNNPYILYCWHNIPGLQKFGAYDGISSSNGTVIDLGFRPRIILLKRYSSDHANAGWHWYDTARDTVNPAYNFILADKPYTERRAANNSSHVSTYYVDFLSNGFKLRHNSTNLNDGSVKYLYAAWAEAPTFNLYGAQSNAR